MKQKSLAVVFTLALLAARAEVVAQTELVNRLVETSKAEMAKKGGKLFVALEWPEKEAKPTLDAFRKEFSFIKETKFERVRTTEAMQRILLEAKGGRTPPYDIFHASSENWPDFEEAGLFPKPPFSYKQLIKSLPNGWVAPDPRAVDPNDEFIATTGLTRGIAYNKNLVPPDKAPKRWEDCLDPMWKGKVLYDPRPKLTALWYDPKTREAHLRWLKGIVENKVVLGRGQTENVQKVSAGEYSLACGINYHSAVREMDLGAPLTFFFPDPFPMEFGTQIHVVKWSQTPATSQLFVLWLATKGPQPLYRGFPWKPGVRKAALAKGKYMAVCDVDCLRKSEEYNQLHARILGLPGAK